MPGRIVRSEDFERVLAQPARARSLHFAVHFAAGTPSRPTGRKRAPGIAIEPEANKLSTGTEQACPRVVDDLPAAGRATRFAPRIWLGTVVPRRHARRAVTRNLIKRQVRSAFERVDASQPQLAPGLWVVRLRAPFDRSALRSAASVALRCAARDELDALLAQCRASPAVVASPRSN